MRNWFWYCTVVTLAAAGGMYWGARQGCRQTYSDTFGCDVCETSASAEVNGSSGMRRVCLDPETGTFSIPEEPVPVPVTVAEASPEPPPLVLHATLDSATSGGSAPIVIPDKEPVAPDNAFEVAFRSPAIAAAVGVAVPAGFRLGVHWSETPTAEFAVAEHSVCPTFMPYCQDEPTAPARMAYTSDTEGTNATKKNAEDSLLAPKKKKSKRARIPRAAGTDATPSCHSRLDTLECRPSDTNWSPPPWPF